MKTEREAQAWAERHLGRRLTDEEIADLLDFEPDELPEREQRSPAAAERIERK